jgi:hypothetical protein
MLGQSVVPTLLFLVHGHVLPICKDGHRGEGPSGFSPCHRAPRIPRARQKYAKRVRRSHAYVVGIGQGGSCSRQGAGVGHFDDIMGLGRGKNYRPRRLARLRPLYKARAGRRLAFGPRVAVMLSAPLAGHFYRGPYNGALANVQGAIFRHPLGTLVY